jgi:hypothetical protein|tara:strand:+ start:1193 stop:1588 length:396 start_codon:yes stop_codon:yes gene_type:complete
MVGPSAAGHGKSVGVNKIERDTSMVKMEWKQEDLELAGELIKNHTATEVGKIFNKSKNAVLGVLYREKIKNGYVPAPDSPYTKARMRNRFNRFKSDPALGEMKCYICSTTFTRSGRFDRFCYECRRTGRVA